MYPPTHPLHIPHICHGRPCKFFLPGVNFYRFNAKNWQFTVYLLREHVCVLDPQYKNTSDELRPQRER